MNVTVKFPMVVDAHHYSDRGILADKVAPAWAARYVLYEENILGRGWTIREEGGRVSGIGWRKLTATRTEIREAHIEIPDEIGYVASVRELRKIVRGVARALGYPVE